MRAAEQEQVGYGGVAADARELFAARWAGLGLVGRWAKLALTEAEALRIG